MPIHFGQESKPKNCNNAWRLPYSNVVCVYLYQILFNTAVHIGKYALKNKVEEMMLSLKSEDLSICIFLAQETE